MTIKKAIEYAKEKNINYIDAKTLIKYLLKEDDKYLIINANNNIDEELETKYKENISKILAGVPLQYITNNQEFMGEKFFVNEDVLIPQPDTEIVVEKTIEKAKEMLKNKTKIKILDLCTGSGAIAVSIKKELKDRVYVHGSDISKKAIEVAKKNTLKILKNSEQIKFIESNLFENINEKYDIVVTNPPYIKTEDIINLPKDVKREPKIALDGGIDGLEFYKKIRKEIIKFLEPNGYLIMEIGYNQKEEVERIYENSECIKDYNGNDRVIIWKG